MQTLKYFGISIIDENRGAFCFALNEIISEHILYFRNYAGVIKRRENFARPGKWWISIKRSARLITTTNVQQKIILFMVTVFLSRNADSIWRIFHALQSVVIESAQRKIVFFSRLRQLFAVNGEFGFLCLLWTEINLKCIRHNLKNVPWIDRNLIDFDRWSTSDWHRLDEIKRLVTFAATLWEIYQLILEIYTP